MGKEFKGRIFKSGNSVALRLPKELGLTEGTEVVLREERQSFRFERVDTPRKKIDVSSFWGAAAGMIHVPSPKEDFEPRPSGLRKNP
jgi:antitoxin VapB